MIKQAIARKTSILLPILKFKGGEVRFVDFAEAEGVWNEAFTSFDFDKVFAIEVAIV